MPGKKPILIFLAGLSGSEKLFCSTFRNPASFKRKYHVVLIENSSSPEWIERNNAILSTGYEAGWQLYLTLNEIKNMPELAPYSKKLNISSVSLGGNDIAFASYFDSIRKTNIISGSIINWSSPANRLAGLQNIRALKGRKKIFTNILLKEVYDQVIKTYPMEEK